MTGNPPAPPRKAAPVAATRVDAAAVPFLPDAAMIEEYPLPWEARGVIYIVAALVVSAALWATLSQVDRVVSARGKLITIDPLIVVQPLETAVVRTIDVGVGDFVRAGTVLATLDPTFTESQEVAGRERLNSMRAEARRLEAEIYEKPFPPPPPDQSLDPRYLALQLTVYVHRRAEYQATVAASEADIARLKASVSTIRTAQDGMAERLKVIGQVEAMRQELFNIAAGSRLNLLTTQLERLSLSDQLAEKKYQEKEVLQQLAAAREQKEKYMNNWVREAGERLSTVQQDIATATQQLASAEHRRALVVLRAPADGVVLELGQRSIGSVAKEAEPLVTLVPRGNKIEAEVDVEAVRAALAAVRAELEALKGIKATLTSISSSASGLQLTLDRLRDGVIARVGEAEAEIRAARASTR